MARLPKPRRSHRYACVCEAAPSEKHSASNYPKLNICCTRHNSSLLDAHILKPGENTADIPDSYVIFITENDVMGKRQAVYHIQRYVETDGGMELFGDGSHIIYVNGTYRGSDEIGRLMHDFSCTDPEDMNYEVLAKRARHFKQEEKGAPETAPVR